MQEKLEKLNLDPVVKERILDWISPSFDEDTRREILKLIEEENIKELTDRFYKILEFGTGGLRGIMEAGTNRMNSYTIAMATQGLANYLLKQQGEKSVVIAYDSRKNSESFSRETSSVLAGNGIKVFIFKSLRPTPELSFAVRYLNATAGIVITASHNPREYNGYKVFWSDGAQIISPHDRLIIEEVKKIKTPSEAKKISFKEGLKKKLIVFIGSEIDSAYLKKVKSLSSDISQKYKDKIRIVYTPLYGAGFKLVPSALKDFGFKKIFLVKEQSKPDGNFPTTPYPNPEEKDALKLALELAEKKRADLVLATDPDSDRLGIAVRNYKTGKMELLNGNQLGSLLLYYILKINKERGTLEKNSCVVKTIVTTDLANRIAESFGVKIFDVFTGFKYIASIPRLYPEYKYLFGFEESYGFLAGDFVRDKDGVSASCLTAELAAWCFFQKKDILTLLDEIYKNFGFFKEKLKSQTFKGKEGMERIKRIMKELSLNPPESIGNRKLVRFLDYSLCRERLVLEKKDIEWKYNLPKADVLAFFYENDLKITIRPSGTEPKIKYYFSICRTIPENVDLESFKIETDGLLDELEKEFSEKVLSIN